MLLAGVEPPPESTEPSCQRATAVGSSATAARSACVIWPILSAMVIRPSRSATRRRTGSRGSRYGRPCAATTTVGRAETVAPSAARVIGTVSAVSAAPSARTVTSTGRVAPDGVPAGKVSVPEAAA
ncbi:hypothetical protein [Micromonospora chersina]|uniref:hypothetical protein n=1 Tax=Micromonospora chersina TaxID=47854 RepID=UPI0037148D0D